MMSTLLTIPNELLSEISAYLEPSTTSHLLITCRSLASRLAPAMLRHAIAPKDGIHALHWAARNRHLPLVMLLLTLFPVDLPGHHGSTALHAAASSHHNLPVLEHLLLNGADVNYTDAHGVTALSSACYNMGITEESAIATVRLLIRFGADINIEVPLLPLMIAVQTCSHAGVQLLLEAGADPSWKDETGDPLVVLAASRGFTAILGLLLQFGADIDGCNSHQSNPLLIAAQYGHFAIVKMLVGMGADLDCVDGDGDTPLMLAICHRQQDIAEYLVGLEGVDIGRMNYRGSPMNQAALVGFDVVLRVLLERGATINDMDWQGRTPLHTAVLYERNSIVQTLLENGAETETVDSSGITPLLLAIETQDLSIATMLIAHGADPINCGTKGYPPLAMACYSGLEGVISLLLEKGVDVNCKGHDGLTPMAWAKIRGRGRLVEILAAHGAVVGDSK